MTGGLYDESIKNGGANEIGCFRESKNLIFFSGRAVFKSVCK